MGVVSVRLDWRLRHGIASLTNFAILLAVLLAFPLVLRWTRALSVAEINPQSPQHTQAFLKFCFVLAAFLWVCFAIALVGIRRSGRITWQELVGVKRSRSRAFVGVRWRSGHLPCHVGSDGSDRKSVECGPRTVSTRQRRFPVDGRAKYG